MPHEQFSISIRGNVAMGRFSQCALVTLKAGLSILAHNSGDFQLPYTDFSVVHDVFSNLIQR